MGELLFFPGFSGSLVLNYSVFTKEDLWWTKESKYVYHPYIMISYGLLKGMDLLRVIKSRKTLYIEEDDNVLIFADSGGLQQFTMNVSINPLEVLDWQMKIADWALMLDYPVTSPKKYYTAEKESYLKAAKYSRKSIELVKDKVKNSDIKFWGILHGADYETMEYWWNEVLADYIDDILYGVSFGIRPPRNYDLLIEAVNFLRKQGVKRIHALALSNMPMLILLGEATKWFELVSTDSSNFSLLAGRGKVYFPMPLPKLTQVAVGYASDKEQPMCFCPACQEYRRMKLNPKNFNLYRYTLASYHNLFVVLQVYATAINALKFDRIDDLAEIYGVSKYLHRLRKGTLKSDLRWW